MDGAPLTYAKAGGPPDNWMAIRVRDLDSGALVTLVTEVNTEEGWLTRYLSDAQGNPLRDETGEALKVERVTGRFGIEDDPEATSGHIP